MNKNNREEKAGRSNPSKLVLNFWRSSKWRSSTSWKKIQKSWKCFYKGARTVSFLEPSSFLPSGISSVKSPTLIASLSPSLQSHRNSFSLSSSPLQSKIKYWGSHKCRSISKKITISTNCGETMKSNAHLMKGWSGVSSMVSPMPFTSNTWKKHSSKRLNLEVAYYAVIPCLQIYWWIRWQGYKPGQSITAGWRSQCHQLTKIMVLTRIKKMSKSS